MSAKIKNEWDLFICHASEDKEDFVRPLAVSLSQLGVKVWYDEFALELGDSLSGAIDKGLATSNYGLVVISNNFIGKGWTDYEFRGLISRELSGEKVILPIWHHVTRNEVVAFSPTLADKLAFRSAEMNAEEIVIGVLKVVRRDIYDEHPRAELERIATGEALRDLQEELEHVKSQIDSCPVCGAELIEKTMRPVASYGEYGECEVEGDFVSYACGYAELEGNTEHPCARDPELPTLADYNLVTEYQEQHSQWMCYARPKTEKAELVRLRAQPGKTEEQARQRVIDASESYLRKR
ncbi:MAG: toll/interleukin-1 receptor domain-containing protein [Acidobacteriota bacterium]